MTTNERKDALRTMRDLCRTHSTFVKTLRVGKRVSYTRVCNMLSCGFVELHENPSSGLVIDASIQWVWLKSPTRFLRSFELQLAEMPEVIAVLHAHIVTISVAD